MFRSVSQAFREGFAGFTQQVSHVSRVFHGCFAGVSRASHQGFHSFRKRFAAVSQVSHQSESKSLRSFDGIWDPWVFGASMKGLSHEQGDPNRSQGDLMFSAAIHALIGELLAMDSQTFRERFAGVSRVFRGCFAGFTHQVSQVSRSFRECFAGVSHCESVR